jgi:oligopeptide transport system ATP-binding protein
VTPTLAVEELRVQFARTTGSVTGVHDVSLTVQPAECVGIVGESGSGKTQIFMAVMGLLPAGARTSGSVRFEGREILGLPPGDLNRIRGSKLGMVFQDPMTSLTPHLRIGTQLAEVLVCHGRLSWRDAERAALRILEQMRIPDAHRRLRQYPHELSGGMRQRVMLGMSLLCAPSLLIADEPTTSLDVTAQAHILELLRALRAESRTAIVLISHDLGVVGSIAERIVVMYGGRVVESAAASRVLRRPQHPYTAELLKCVPDVAGPRLDRMPCLPGQPPAPAETERERGCAFAPRCGHAQARCTLERPRLEERTAAHAVACHFPLSPTWSKSET